MSDQIQILLTNDDGIQSPGLWAAAAALSKLGYVTVAAPRDQASSTGRSLPRMSDGRIEKSTLRINDQTWPVYAVGGTPAQVVLHAVLEIMPEKPQLVVSGINYGENLGTSVTVSGTVGAAMEAAAAGIPSIAVSLQLMNTDYYSYSNLDFSAAAHFTHLFAKMLLEKPFPADVD
ncbi:MAG TPA: 5'/3'-nucleotidase SurE, partial [Anaerolineaceae bacterium]